MKKTKMISQRIAVKDMMLVGMCSALLAVSAQISIPLMGVYLTLQTFAVALCGMLLGWKLGSLSVMVYLLIGVFGMPVFSGMRGGIAMLFGKSGGFLFGFIAMALLCGLGMKMKHKIVAIAVGFMGLAICHVFGILQFSIVAHVPLPQSAALVSLPFLLKDAVSLVLAYYASILLKTRIRQSK